MSDDALSRGGAPPAPAERRDTRRPAMRPLFLLPLGVFLVLAGLFLVQLLSGRDAATVPSALLGASAPQTTLPPLEGSNLPGLDPALFRGGVTLVNVWASWCAPCRAEHPLLMALARKEGLRIVGLNYKDDPANARSFLGELGNPFAAVGADPNGRAAIEWGVYGVPESFLVGPDGVVRFKHVGPLTPEAVSGELLPTARGLLSQR